MNDYTKCENETAALEDLASFLMIASPIFIANGSRVQVRIKS